MAENKPLINASNVYRIEWTGEQFTFAGQMVKTATAEPIAPLGVAQGAVDLTQQVTARFDVETNTWIPGPLHNVLDGATKGIDGAAAQYPGIGTNLKLSGGVLNGVGLANDANNVVQHLIDGRVQAAIIEASGAAGELGGTLVGAKIGAELAGTLPIPPHLSRVGGAIVGGIGGSIVGGEVMKDIARPVAAPLPGDLKLEPTLIEGRMRGVKLRTVDRCAGTHRHRRGTDQSHSGMGMV